MRGRCTGRKRKATRGKWILTLGMTRRPNVTALAPASVPKTGTHIRPRQTEIRREKKSVQGKESMTKIKVANTAQEKARRDREERFHTEAPVSPSDEGIM